MTTEEKRKLQDVAARYEKYGYTFIGLLRCISNAPKEFSFRKSINILRATLGITLGEPEYFSLEEAAELVGETMAEFMERVGAEATSFIKLS